MKYSYTQNISTYFCSILVISLFITPSFSFAQQKVPVIDESHIEVSQQILNVLTTLMEKELQKDPLEEAAAKQELADSTQEEIEYIQEGYKGYLQNAYLPGIGDIDTSFFETDLEEFYNSVRESEFNRFMEENFGYDFNSDETTFNPDPNNEHPGQNLNVIGTALRAKYDNTSEGYTLDTVTGGSENTQAFLEGDFSQGGWDAWYSLSQNPENNAYGQYFQASESLDNQISKNIVIEEQKLEWGQGFHALEKADGTITTPSVLNLNQLNQAISTCNNSLEAIDEYTGELLPDSLGNMCDAIREGLNSTTGLLETNFDFAELFDLDFSGLVQDLLHGVDMAGSVLNHVDLGGIGL